MQTKIEKISPLSALAVNIIEEVSGNDIDFLSFREKLSYANISRADKQVEWKSARIAIKSALDCISLPYPGFFKDENGKSHPMDGYGFVSLSHTKGVAAAIFHKDMPVGIDLDYIREKVVRLGPKFLDEQEMDFLNNDPALHTIAWSAKESIFKCQGKRGVSLKNNILLEPFAEGDSLIKGRIYGTEFSDHHYQVKVEREADIILTYTVW
ncbi:Siderophore (Surfactin) biosynthesis regulatory protein [Indibacter alkaliphilus LW1]|jgi:phosphopantetheinyl transferase|uniref:Siderophore (Surfactin) biosynthesis regulatory protein n=1 Tax=Indibacter alkaliphilus (strain CCUG 57479 / KCTC 22604 / LW1) TaxID=1189612 RepID=S2D8A8_INDAL|nr:4'-phosphopantetheinyl transferase superfamily protein [Indibacter alkaliphilus]EOZ95139.1 Siderophore (Surfactin) biosynthesis regulatory protein [Indibacter alkaliphilus LW1]